MSNYTRGGNIDEVQQRLIRAIQDMVSFNTSLAINAHFERNHGWLLHRDRYDTREEWLEDRDRQDSDRQHLTPVAQTTTKAKVIAKKKLEEQCPSECAICQEAPKYKDALCTDCNHYYCKPCWNVWMNAANSNHSCPTCRKSNPNTTTYRHRASPKPKISNIK
jgi:hypothetical protein